MSNRYVESNYYVEMDWDATVLALKAKVLLVVFWSYGI